MSMLTLFVFPYQLRGGDLTVIVNFPLFYCENIDYKMVTRWEGEKLTTGIHSLE